MSNATTAMTSRKFLPLGTLAIAPSPKVPKWILNLPIYIISDLDPLYLRGRSPEPATIIPWLGFIPDRVGIKGG